MTSKISTPNIPLRKLMREDMRHRSWMLTLSCLGSFIASPVLFLFINTVSFGSEYASARLDTAAAIDPAMAARELSERFLTYFATDHLILQTIVLFIGALILAIRGFQYLYSRRMIDLYHSTPATRERIFLSIWLDGFLIWFLPFLLGHLSVYILALYQIRMPAFWGGLTVLMLKELGLFVLCFLILYNACLVPVMISGNAKNAFVNMLIYGLTVLLSYGTYFGYMARYLDTFYSRDDSFLTSPFIALSPLASPFFLCGYFSNRVLNDPSATDFMIETPRWIVLLAVSVLLMLVNLFVAMALHKRRPSELAERGVENPWFRIPLNAIASVLAGLLLSLFFSVIEWEKNLGWTLFGAVFGCVLTFACMNILHHASFKALFRHKLQLALTLAFTLGVTLVFFYDAFGYDRYLPREKDITGITLYSSSFCGSGFGIVKDEDGLYTRSYTAFDAPDNITFTDKEQNYRLLKTLVDRCNNRPELISKDSRALSVSVRVNTTHGSYARTYFVYYKTVSDLEALKPFLESAEFREFNHPAASGIMDPPVQIDVNSLDKKAFSVTEPQRIEQLYQAYAQDFTEHFDIACALKNSDRTLQMEYRYLSSSTKSASTRYHRFDMNVPAWYKRTTALLREWFPDAVWSKEDLDLTTLSINIDSAAAGDTLASLQAYLGLPKDSKQSAQDQSVASSESSERAGNKYSWSRVITDPVELKALQPYLYLGSYSSNTFVAVGNLTILRDNDPNHLISLQCYMKRGEIPPGFAESLHFREKSTSEAR